MQVFSKTRSRRSRRVAMVLLLAIASGLVVAGIPFVHPFLAVSAPVPADVLVVEGWVPEHVLRAAGDEFHNGDYAYVLTSGMSSRRTDGSPPMSYADQAARQLASFGIEPSHIVACPSPYTVWNRTAASARAVRDVLQERGIHPRGINVITAGPHARQTWIAYRRMMAPIAPVGIISIPKINYDAERWWTSREGLKWVTKDFVAWLKELTIGSRS